VNVHKASHHGSANGDTMAGIASLSPDVVVVGVGAGNSYRHPDAQALALYGDAGASVFRTDLNGTVIVEVAATGTYQVHVERGEGAQPPPSLPSPSTPTFTLAGTVTNQTGRSPVSGVIVQALDGLNVNSVAFSGTNGAYALSGLQRGSSIVRFTKTGYDSIDRSATFPSTAALNVALTRTCTPPEAPTLSASVSGRTVTFGWTPVSGATSYVLDVGTTPGGSGALATATALTSHTWSDVSAGSYYARVRAKNTCGSGGTSNDATFAVASSGGGSNPSTPPSSWSGALPAKSSGSRAVCQSPLPSIASCLNDRVGEPQAVCTDRTFSCSTGSGTCSGHQGVYCWRN
jgi:hypothetical protein